MTNYNEEYFYLDSTGDSFPMIQYAAGNICDSMELFDDIVLDTNEVRYLCFAKPIPRSPKLADFHFLQENSPAISERLKQVLESFNLKSVQFLPAVIRDKSDTEHSGYYIIHVLNLIKCMDKENSEWEPDDDDEEQAFDVEKLVLDNEVLDKIPLEERLVFALWENHMKVLFHYSVVEKLLEVTPTGMTIYRLSKWDSSAPFKAEYISKLLGEE